MKEGLVKQGLSAPEMGKINSYTRRAYTPEEVYAFSLVLCDNEVDRDWERFSLEALEGLRELFPGKTLLFDHERRSASQTARIYDTALETEPGKSTQAGEVYTKNRYTYYLPRTEKNREVIELIESGILKEVSVGCSMGRSVCSICGKERCGHVKGRPLRRPALPPGALRAPGRLRVLLCGGAGPAGGRGGEAVPGGGPRGCGKAPGSRRGRRACP